MDYTDGEDRRQTCDSVGIMSHLLQLLAVILLGVFVVMPVILWVLIFLVGIVEYVFERILPFAANLMNAAWKAIGIDI